MFDLGDLYPDNIESMSGEVRDTILALNLKMQAILMCRESMNNHELPNIKADFSYRRVQSLNLINELVPMPTTLVREYTHEVVDDGWGYYYIPDSSRLVEELACFLANYPEILDRDELENYLEMQYYPCDGDESEEGISIESMLATYDALLGDDPDTDLRLMYLERVSEDVFGGDVTASDLLPILDYCLHAFARGGYIRIVKSYLIKGLDLNDKELEKEIRELYCPLISWDVEPALIQIGDDALLSFPVYSQDCYSVSEELERPMWRLALKTIEDKLLRRGENA